GWAAWVYAVPHYTNVPNVSGLSVRDAAAKLKAAGLSVVFGDPVFSTTVPSGVVVRTSPGPGAKLRKGSAVSVIESAGPGLLRSGWAAWVYAVPHYTNVPNVSGLSVRDAAAKLKAAGLSVVFGDPVFSTTVPSGVVVRTSPGPGAKLRKGSAVSVIESAGPELL